HNTSNDTYLPTLHRPSIILHSFPTRRSSDLCPKSPRFFKKIWKIALWYKKHPRTHNNARGCFFMSDEHERPDGAPSENADEIERSEEHTSELQSRFDLVCRLLLEKKKDYVRV